jgi:uncharacterized protein (DUF849 family)
MANKVIITCAVTGAIHTPSMSPYLPVTPQEIADAAIGAAEAGAACVHVHARDPETGRPDQSPEAFAPILQRVKQASNAVVNITTGGAPTMSVQERVRPAETFRPEVASLNMGSMNFGLYPILTTCAENQTRFEIECYDIGHLYTLAHFADRGIVKPPFFVQSVFGILGGIGTHEEDVIHMKRTADRLFGSDYRWSVLGAGRHQMRIAAMAAGMGGNVRVGLEDSLWGGPKELAKSNAEQVTRVRGLIEGMGLEIASPDEAREMLQLKGADRVGF